MAIEQKTIPQFFLCCLFLVRNCVCVPAGILQVTHERKKKTLNNNNWSDVSHQRTEVWEKNIQNKWGYITA